MPRSKRNQSKHDTEVQKLARKYENQGYNVKADIPGYSKPSTISGYRPDVEAKKGWERKIYEVETPDSVNSARDKQQQQAFRQAARKSKHTTFKRTITDD